MSQGAEYFSPNIEDDSRIQDILGYINEITDPEKRILFIEKLEQAILLEKERALEQKMARINIHNSFSEELVRRNEEFNPANTSEYRENVDIDGGGDV